MIEVVFTMYELEKHNEVLRIQVPTVPRKGELVFFPSGNLYHVHSVYHKVSTDGVQVYVFLEV